MMVAAFLLLSMWTPGQDGGTGAASASAADGPAALQDGLRLLQQEDNTPPNLKLSIAAFGKAAASTLPARERARALAFQGLAHMRLGDLEKSPAARTPHYEAAMASTQAAVTADANSADAWFYRGATVGRWAQQKGMVKALTHLGEIRGAFEKALQKDPHHHGALLALGIMEKQIPTLMGGSTTRAEARFRQVLKEDPHHTRAMLDLAEFLHEDGRTDEARTWVTKARDETAPTQPGEWRKFDRPRALRLLEELR